jgi:two-component system sensor histidine kinase NblS
MRLSCKNASSASEIAYRLELPLPRSWKLFDRLHILWRKMSAQKQLLLLGILTISALVTLTAWIWVSRAQEVINHSVQQFGLALAEALARGGAEALTNKGNLEGLKYYILTERGKTPALTYVAFCDKDGHVLFDSVARSANGRGTQPIYRMYEDPRRYHEVPGAYPSPAGYRSITNIVVPMTRNGEELGICWVGLDNNAFTILGTPRETRYFLMSVFGLVGLLGAVGLFTNYAFINRPLKRLSMGAAEIAKGNFGHQIQSQRAGREIDQVVTTFNYMSTKLEDYDRQNFDQLMSERNKYISERNKLEHVLMSIADGVVVCDQSNRVQIVNAAATSIFAKDASELVGKPLVFCTEGPDSPAICRVVQDFTDSLSPSSLEPVVQTMHLEDKVVRLHIAPIILNTEFLGSVIIMHDITKQAELERMKNEFISNVSHELRTPITSIKSYVDTLCNHGEKLDPDIYREFLTIIDSEADRLMFLVNDVLELSRVEEGEREFELHSLDLKQAAEAAIRSVNLMARDRQIELVLTANDNLPRVMMNEESIERVIINLLTNAIKYTPIGGRIDVKVEHRTENNEVGCLVSDNGIGIPEDALAQIFDRFYRVERKVHTIKGTGLGLTIVKKIIEKHNGRVGVESSLGQGSTFSFFIPATSLQNLPTPEASPKSTTPLILKLTTGDALTEA